jgi:hypothetical protein
VNEYFPESWRSSKEFMVSAYDPTYGENYDIERMSECQVCGAWVSMKELHVGWHEGLSQ